MRKFYSLTFTEGAKLKEISGGCQEQPLTITILKDKPPSAGKVYCDTQKNE